MVQKYICLNLLVWFWKMIISGEDESNSICWHFHVSIIFTPLSKERMFCHCKLILRSFCCCKHIFFTKALSSPLQFITSIVMEKKHGGSSVDEKTVSQASNVWKISSQKCSYDFFHFLIWHGVSTQCVKVSWNTTPII